MRNILIRCSSLGRIMTSPTAAASKAGELLSVGAKTYIRELAAQDLFGVDFVVSSREMEKGIRCEQDSIDLLNRVSGLSLVKNFERRSDGFITGEADLVDEKNGCGYDIKTAWSVKTFPMLPSECEDSIYEWQFRGYMKLWDVSEWRGVYCLVNTPEDLIGYEPITLHSVDHIPEHMRVTVWKVKRDAEKEAQMIEKIKAAREYYEQVIHEFDRAHSPEMLAA